MLIVSTRSKPPFSGTICVQGYLSITVSNACDSPLVDTILNIQMGFTWDHLNKRPRNLRDHEVSFEAATEVFFDPKQVVSESYFIEDEQRYQIIGMTGGVVLLLVVFFDESNNEEGFHLISARKAVKYEQEIYAAQIG